MTFVSAGGRRFAVSRTLGGSPTIVFETGLGAESREWAQVAALLADANATLVYDRLNRGDSDRVDGPRTSAQMAADLRMVLDAAGAAPPYILVGHSFGAHVVLAFADGAADVAGVVLVEPTHPLQFDTFGPNMPPGEMREFWTRGWLRTDTTAEHIDLPASFAITDRVRLGRVPLHVLVAEPMAQFGVQAQQAWVDLASQWLAMASDATLQVAAGSGHFVQRERPDVIVEAIQSLLARSGTRTTSA